MGSDFAKNIEKFRLLNDKTAGGYIIYSGDQEQKVKEIGLVNFKKTAEHIQ